MTIKLSEEDMREALFGVSDKAELKTPSYFATTLKQQTSLTIRNIARPGSPKLRVVLRVTKEFEGEVEEFTYYANTLSTLMAEHEAKAEAKKKFKYSELVSITPI